MHRAFWAGESQAWVALSEGLVTGGKAGRRLTGAASGSSGVVLGRCGQGHFSCCNLVCQGPEAKHPAIRQLKVKCKVRTEEGPQSPMH